MDRSYATITLNDLRRLQSLALQEMKIFMQRNSKYSKLKLIAIALCQGAALHYLNKTNGVKDFDVWFFFMPDGDLQFPHRWKRSIDSGLVNFGIHPNDYSQGFKGRRVDFLGRTICNHCEYYAGCAKQQINPIECLRGYLNKQATQSAEHLAKKAVIGIYPDAIFGKIIWP